MNVLLIKNIVSYDYVQSLSNSISELGARCFMADWNDKELWEIILKNELTPADTIIHARTAGRGPNKKFSELESKGFQVINSPATLELTSNKYQAQVHAQKHSIPIAESFLFNKSKHEALMEQLARLGKMVLKPVYSSGQGIHCHLVESEMPREEIVAKLESIPGTEILAQAFVPYRRLIRTIILDFKCISDATTYDFPRNGWKCSVCLNPLISKYHVDNNSKELFELAEKTARAFNGQISFIDFFETPERNFILNEVNTACALQLHERKTGVNIHTKIARLLVEKLHNIRQSRISEIPVTVS